MVDMIKLVEVEYINRLFSKRSIEATIFEKDDMCNSVSSRSGTFREVIESMEEDRAKNPLAWFCNFEIDFQDPSCITFYGAMERCDGTDEDDE